MNQTYSCPACQDDVEVNSEARKTERVTCPHCLTHLTVNTDADDKGNGLRDATTLHIDHTVTLEQRGYLRPIVQDLHHYCLLLLGAQDGQESTFVGDRTYDSLLGRINAYSAMRDRINMTGCVIQSFALVEIPAATDLRSYDDLLANTRKVWDTLQAVCRANNIDGYSGELVPRGGLNFEKPEVF